MSPWKIIGDFIGWSVIALFIAGVAAMWAVLIVDYARRLWDARGEAPRIYDDGTTTTSTEPAPRQRREP